MEAQHKPLLMLRSKVVIVGDAYVGKTAITQMLISSGHNYPKNYLMTTDVDFSVKQIRLPEVNCCVELFLFDCAGQGVFNKLDLNAVHWDNASFVCVVFDVCNRESFQSCGRWLQGVRATRPTAAPMPGVLIGSKADLREGSRAVVDAQEGARFAQENGLAYFEVSAAMSSGVEAPFQHMAQQFHTMYEASMRKAEGLAGVGGF
ncbi:IFT27, ras superfamily GTPase [Tribonema minus]|uniref:IFT27, ras superfamily GTPase n=1 Tax=Tribonema minus TaxID=303371 RepID=A0A835ZCC9_9STRA|nr:IFT27, ras superfamily GTPase [Tribonema minus]